MGDIGVYAGLLIIVLAGCISYLIWRVDVERHRRERAEEESRRLSTRWAEEMNAALNQARFPDAQPAPPPPAPPTRAPEQQAESVVPAQRPWLGAGKTVHPPDSCQCQLCRERRKQEWEPRS